MKPIFATISGWAAFLGLHDLNDAAAAFSLFATAAYTLSCAWEKFRKTNAKPTRPDEKENQEENRP